jgi:hypothetical protein
LLSKIKESLIHSTTDRIKELLKTESYSIQEERTDVADAQAALRAYWANKRECYLREEFNPNLSVHKFLKNVLSFLIKIFGPTLYLDHITEDSADLYFKGGKVAELLYDNQTEEMVITPEDNKLSPVEVSDTSLYSLYEVQDYLSDLLLGDVDPQLA